jgi:hypothetical protein
MINSHSLAIDDSANSNPGWEGPLLEPKKYLKRMAMDDYLRYRQTIP